MLTTISNTIIANVMATCILMQRKNIIIIIMYIILSVLMHVLVGTCIIRYTRTVFVRHVASNRSVA